MRKKRLIIIIRNYFSLENLLLYVGLGHISGLGEAQRQNYIFLFCVWIWKIC